MFRATKLASAFKPLFYFILGLILGLVFSQFENINNKLSIYKNIFLQTPNQSRTISIENDRAASTKYHFYDKLVEQEQPLQKTVKNNPKSYKVQAGIFSNKKDAEHLQATLVLGGVMPKVEPIKLEDGIIRYRVIVGEFYDKKLAQNLQYKLRSLSIYDAVII